MQKKNQKTGQDFKVSSMLFSSSGMALVTTLLTLTLMTLSGFALLYFATRDIQVSGNDRMSRILLHRVEGLGLYLSQDIWDKDPDYLLRGSPQRELWLQTEAEAANLAELGTGKSFNALTDKEFNSFVAKWPEKNSGEVFFSDDSVSLPFLGDGSGRVLVVDLGPSGVGSQDIGGAVLHEYIVFSEYDDGRGNVRFLETGLRRKQ
ncbi:hypothetical protein [Desulfobotulus mexicanus]|uniref:Type 4 fimbrial biogenesis protein PilX N-terminal domain-containing protein n=1 Tax=Desulfobotulus mexicanus TaxID=2586642 RepID=A0A5Q4VBH7_9BACT|nr:hypothetical protein [Desulfobotulus mexicanus]TYT75084.1 hypothetical protein FIM25_06735 [Desulfobotulus mexicanus]